MNLLDRFNLSGKVAVWGIGYLGYTTLLRCHHHGMSTHIWTMDGEHLEDLQQGNYPGKNIQIAWSDIGSVPQVSPHRMIFAHSAEELFKEELPVHWIALPNHPAKENSGRLFWHEIAAGFKAHAKRDREYLVLLASASTPGETEAFIESLGNARKMVRVVTAFRSDWVLEDFLYRPVPQALGGREEDLPLAEAFLRRMGLETFRIGSHHDAEVYQACMSGFQCLTSAFVSQFSFAYPGNNVRRISREVLNNCDLSKIGPAMGVGGKRMMTGLEFLFRGSDYNNLLSILKEAQAFNLSSILFFADFLARYGTGRVGILGITPQPDNLDLAYSPSLLLAEALMQRGIEVLVHDPYFDFETVKQLLPGVQHLDLKAMADSPRLGRQDALVLMTPHRFYLEFTQSDIDEKIAGKAGIVIDNTGIWSQLTFSGKTQYYFVGDGTLNINS